jgi:hypothetical protein
MQEIIETHGRDTNTTTIDILIHFIKKYDANQHLLSISKLQTLMSRPHRPTKQELISDHVNILVNNKILALTEEVNTYTLSSSSVQNLAALKVITQVNPKTEAARRLKAYFQSSLAPPTHKKIASRKHLLNEEVVDANTATTVKKPKLPEKNVSSYAGIQETLNSELQEELSDDTEFQEAVSDPELNELTVATREGADFANSEISRLNKENKYFEVYSRTQKPGDRLLALKLVNNAWRESPIGPAALQEIFDNKNKSLSKPAVKNPATKISTPSEWTSNSDGIPAITTPTPTPTPTPTSKHSRYVVF